MYTTGSKGHRYAPVGSYVFNNYWGKHYTVLSHNTDGTVTVEWEGDDGVKTHRTPFDQVRDRIMTANQHKVQVLDPIAKIAAASMDVDLVKHLERIVRFDDPADNTTT